MTDRYADFPGFHREGFAAFRERRAPAFAARQPS